MWLASALTVAFLVAGVSAFRWVLGDRSRDVRASLKVGLVIGACIIPLQIFMGDMHGLNTKAYQPAKVAAMEGVWETQTAAPLLLFALPDEDARENRAEIGIPGLASFILTHDWNGKVKGLNEFVAEDGTPLHPPVNMVFWSFRVMVGTGVAMLLLSWTAVFFMWYRRTEHAFPEERHWLAVDGLPKLILYALVPMAFSGWVATLAGWYTTEIGRQPWLVQGVITTHEAVAEVPAPLVAGTLISYLAVYAALLIAYVSVIIYLARKAAQGGRDHSDNIPLSGATQGVTLTPAE